MFIRLTNGGITKSKEMAKKRKLNSKNPKYWPKDKLNEPKIKRKVLMPNSKGLIVYGIWYENNL